MAVSTTTALLLASAAAAGATAYNTNRTAKKQDNAAADAIRAQSKKQQEADARVRQQVDSIGQSTSTEEREQALTGYNDQLHRNVAALEQGLSGQTFGSDAFKQRGEEAAGKAGDATKRTAGFMARIDAPAMQRMGEGFSNQRFAEDIGILGRESAGQRFLDDLRIRAIRRSPWIDAGAAALGGLASSGIGQSAASGASSFGPYASGYRFPGGG